MPQQAQVCQACKKLHKLLYRKAEESLRENNIFFPKFAMPEIKRSAKASNANAYTQNKASRTTGPANQGSRRMLSHPGCAPQHAGPKD
jgi:hypothetical protein